MFVLLSVLVYITVYICRHLYTISPDVRPGPKGPPLLDSAKFNIAPGWFYHLHFHIQLDNFESQIQNHKFQ